MVSSLTYDSHPLPIAAATLAIDAYALLLDAKTEATMDASCLQSYEMISRIDAESDTAGLTMINNMDQISMDFYADENDYHLSGISVCLEEDHIDAGVDFFGEILDFHNNKQHGAVIGLQVILKGADGKEMYPDPIGNMWCGDDEYYDLMHLTGGKIGKIKLQFEEDADAGVALKVKGRDSREMVEEIGEWERAGDGMVTQAIPLDEEIIGFHGTTDDADQILALGIVTRKKDCQPLVIEPEPEAAE